MKEMSQTLAQQEDIELKQALDERADHIPVDELKSGTARADFFDHIHNTLVARGTKLLIGPRGCGKTHMMRYTWLLCRDDATLPLAIYVSFNRYYRLEPLLRTRSNAVDLFHAWVLARIFEALSDLLSSPVLALEPEWVPTILGVDVGELRDLIAKLERGLPLSTSNETVLASLSIQRLISTIERACDITKRRRAVILLDDAALTLTPEYLFEFFDIVRVLRTQRISPKASVYPATDFGPRFHASHEADSVPVWLSVDRSDYMSLMGAIRQTRLPDLSVPNEVDSLLKFAAFGVPRAYLTMLREYTRGSGSQQQLVNKVVEGHAISKREEYESMAIKMPRFESILRTGTKLFDGIISEVKCAQVAALSRDEKQLVVGIIDSEVSSDPLIERMFNLLIEAGLLYEAQTVSHGSDRIYRRYMPHIASLIAARAVVGASRSSAASQLVEVLEKKSSKHPLRRRLSKMVDVEALKSLKIDLPACRVCGTQRLTSQQRFCTHCGSELLDGSTFARCMGLPLADVPGLTDWQRERVSTLDRVKTIGDLLAIQDPGSELRKLHRIGNVRASRMIELVTSFVDEFLS